MTLTFGSLFAGVGGFDMGFERAGWDCKFQVEWDKNCRTILDKHWPDVEKWGDVCNVNGRFLPPVDCIIFGSPCQDLSVAGKRAGLEGERSGLFHEAVRIIKEMRDATNGAFPRWTVWENVAGALSSNNGRDFGTVINEMAKAGAHLQEYALLDAQHFGIPQRRRRVFLVSCFDPATATNCPSPLLPVSESLRGDTKKGKPKRKSATSETSESVGAGSPGEQFLTEESYAESSFAQFKEGDVAALKASGGVLGGGSETLIVGALTVSDLTRQVTNEIVSKNLLQVVEPYVKSRRAQTATDDETWVPGEVNPTLNSFDVGDTRATTAIIEPMLVDGTRVDDVRVYEQPVQTLGARMGTGGNNVPMLAFDTQFGSNANVFEDQSPTLKASQAAPSVQHEMAVRRLTPLECERLMGWPDDHTRYKADGTEQADTHRYKQCGNGVASPVAQWVAEQIRRVEYAEG